MTALRIYPCTVKQAIAYVRAYHRRLPKIQGARFACAVGGGAPMREWHGVGVVGNGPQEWEGTGRASITRVATDGARNACSAIYGPLALAARALGYVEAWTYTLPDEPGTSLRAAGFDDMGLSDGGEHDREGRPRAPAACSEPKRRWRRRLSDRLPWESTCELDDAWIAALDPDDGPGPLFGPLPEAAERAPGSVPA